jgi:hypothetical protein
MGAFVSLVEQSLLLLRKGTGAAVKAPGGGPMGPILKKIRADRIYRFDRRVRSWQTTHPS